MADSSPERLIPPTIDSEKPTARKRSLISRIFLNDKLPLILTFISAVIAFFLSLVALLSGAKKGQLQDYEVVIVRPRSFIPPIIPSFTPNVVKHLNHSPKRR
jgi:hypothetical protein